MACVAPCGVTWRCGFPEEPSAGAEILAGGAAEDTQHRCHDGQGPPWGEDLGSILWDFGTAFPEASISRGAVPSTLCFLGVGDWGVPMRGQAVGCLRLVTGGAEPAEQGCWQSCGQGPHTQARLGCISLNSILNKINLN